MRKTAKKSIRKIICKPSHGFTDQEKDALKGRAKKLNASARRGSKASELNGETQILVKISEMRENKTKVVALIQGAIS